MKKISLIVIGLVFALVLFKTSKVEAQSSQFVSINSQGTGFSLNNTPFYWYGATIYPHFCRPTLSNCQSSYSGDSWRRTDFTDYLDNFVFATASQTKMNVLRVVDYLQGMNATSTTFWNNSTLWSNMDYAINTGYQKHGLRFLLDFATLRNKMADQSTANIYNMNDPFTKDTWNSFLDFVVNRYKNNPGVVGYTIAGEVPCPNWSDPKRPHSSDELVNFYQTISNKIRSIDTNHVILAGGFLFTSFDESNCGIPWSRIFTLPNIQVAAIHVYSAEDENKGWPKIASIAKANKRPLVVEEFGFKQEIGDSTRANNFKRIYQLGVDPTHGASGMIFWNFDPEVRGSTFAVYPNTPETWKVVLSNDFVNQIGQPTQPTPSRSADANSDGVVDSKDYDIWKANYNQSVSGKQKGDFNGDGKVDGIDYAIWASQYK